jgi:hypothetical protein
MNMETKTDANIIKNIDLYTKQYTEEELAKNIENLFPMTIIKTQKNLSKQFIDEYILTNNDYESNDEDNITMSVLNQMQPNYFISQK